MADRQKGKHTRRLFSSLIAPDIIALKATGTFRKLSESNSVAWANRDQYRFLAAFRPLSRYSIHHAPIETGETGIDNADLKIQDSTPAFRLLSPGNQFHSWFVETIYKEGLIADPRKFDPRRVLHATDDMTLALPRDVWRFSRPVLQEYIDKSYLRGEKRDIDGRGYISLPDISQIIGSVGPQRFSNIIRQSALKAKYRDKPLIIYSQIAYALTRMSDAEGAAVTHFEARNPMVLWAADGLDRPLRVPPRPIHQLEDFFYTPDNPNQPITEDYGGYLKGPAARNEIIKKMIGWAMGGLKSNAATYDFKSCAQQANRNCAQTSCSEQELRIVQPMDGSFKINEKQVERIGKLEIVKRGLANRPNGLVDHINAFAMEYDFGQKRQDGQPLFEHPDGVIFPPFDIQNPDECLEAMSLSASAHVAAALDPRRGPIVYINLDGCWNSILGATQHLSNKGYNKNFVLHSFHDTREATKPIVSVEGVTHFANYFYDVVSGSDLRGLVRAAKHILQFRLSQYTRLELPHQLDPQIEQKEDGRAKPVGLYAVVPIGSASSTLEPLNKDAHAYTRFIAENGMAMSWGGGDQYTMGGFYDGYREGKGPWLCGISTHRIIKEEAKFGRIPNDCDYWQLSRALPSRLLGLFAGVIHETDNRRIFDGADLVPSFDGGDGTNQEEAVFLQLKWLMPEAMANKWLVVYIPPYSSKEPTTRCLLGNADYDRLIKDHDVLAHRQILLATSIKELREHTLELGKLKVEQRQAILPAFDRIFDHQRVVALG